MSCSIQPAPDGILILSSDVTERKRAELEIRALNTALEQRVRDLHRAARSRQPGIRGFRLFHLARSHAPLRAMEGFSAILLSRYADQLDEQGRHYLDRIQQACQRMDS